MLQDAGSDDGCGPELAVHTRYIALGLRSELGLQVQGPGAPYSKLAALLVALSPTRTAKMQLKRLSCGMLGAFDIHILVYR